MTKADQYMKNDIAKIFEYGYKDINPRPKYKDGTPAHTLSVNHVVRTYDLSAGEFPICTLRPQAWKTAIKEILWIYQDQSNDLSLLRDKYSIKYWDDWESKAMPNTIGQRYGYVVNKYNLMNELLIGLKENPYGRRHIIDLYQYQELDETDGLYPCAFLTIWNVRKSNITNLEYLDMCLIQRSGDMLTASGAGGINEIQYAALQIMVARHCGYEVGVFTHFVANEQIYDRHEEQAFEMLSRANSLTKFEHTLFKDLPYLVLNPDVTDFYEITINDFEMKNYVPIKPQLTLELGI